jgi:hypothetical protein
MEIIGVIVAGIILRGDCQVAYEGPVTLRAL